LDYVVLRNSNPATSPRTNRAAHTLEGWHLWGGGSNELTDSLEAEAPTGSQPI